MKLTFVMVKLRMKFLFTKYLKYLQGVLKTDIKQRKIIPMYIQYTYTICIPIP